MVRSQRRSCDVWHLVTLDNPAFPHGHCMCEHFKFRVEPFLVRGLEPEHGQDCIHIRRTRSELEHARSLCEMAGLEFDEAIIRPF